MQHYNLYPNMQIGDIIKKCDYINFSLLLKVSGKNKRYVLRQLHMLLRQRKIIRIERGKYTIYVWKSKSNPYVNIFGIWDYNLAVGLQKWIKIQLQKGDEFMKKELEKKRNKLETLKSKHTPFERELDEYIHKMFFSDKIKTAKSTFFIK